MDKSALLFKSLVFAHFFFKQRTLLFTKDALHWSKSIMKTFIVLQTISISNKCSSFRLYIIKNIKQHNCFQHWFKKTETLLEWFLKDHVTLKTGVMVLKIQLYHHRNKLDFKIYSNRNNYNYSQYSCFYCILIVVEHKTSFKNIIKITYQPQTFEQQCMVTPKLQTTIIREILLAM